VCRPYCNSHVGDSDESPEQHWLHDELRRHDVGCAGKLLTGLVPSLKDAVKKKSDYCGELETREELTSLLVVGLDAGRFRMVD